MSSVSSFSSSSSSKTALSCATAAETQRSLMLNVFSSLAIISDLSRALHTKQEFLSKSERRLRFVFLIFTIDGTMCRRGDATSGIQRRSGGKSGVLRTDTTVSADQQVTEVRTYP